MKLIVVVDMFIMSSDVMSVDLWLIWLLKCLNRNELIGCVMNVMLNVMNVDSVCVVVELCGKNMGLMMSVVVVVYM